MHTLSLPTILLFSSLLAFLMTALYFTLSQKQRQVQNARAFLLLALAHALWGVRLICLYWTDGNPASLLFPLSDLFNIGWIVALWLGSRAYCDLKKVSRVFWAVPALLALWVIFSRGFNLSFICRTIPLQFTLTTFLFLSGFYFWTLNRSNEKRRMGFLSILLWIYSLDLFIYPFTRLTWYAPYGFLLAALIVPAISMWLMISALLEEQCDLLLEMRARKRIEEALHEREKYISSLVEHSPVAMVIWSSNDDRVLLMNWKFTALFGYSIEEAPTINDWWPLAYPDEEYRKTIQDKWVETVETTAAGHGESIPMEASVRCKDGSVRQIEFRCSSIGSENIVTFVDLTERKQAEEVLQRLNRELRAISDCNQTLIRAENEQTLLDNVCRIICDEAGYRMAWVGCPENDRDKTIRPLAWAGVEEGYLGTANITWDETGERGRGPVGTAVRSGKSVCIQDFAADPQVSCWRDGALRRGYRSCITLPLADANGNIFAVLAIYSPMPNTFTADEVRLLEELAGDLAFGITVLRARMEHQRMEEQLRRLSDLQSIILNNAAYMVISVDSQGIVTTFNPAAERTLGYTADELIGKASPLIFHDPNEILERARVFSQELDTVIPPTFEVFAAKARRNLPNEYEWTYICKDGSRLPVLLSVTALSDSAGGVIGFLGIAIDIAERKRAEAERLVHLRFLEGMEQLNRAIQGTSDLEKMMSDALDTLLEVFHCDRAWLVYPCDPEAPTWQSVMERTRPEYPGAFEKKLIVPVEPLVVENFKALRATDGPVTFGPGFDMPLSSALIEVHGILSMIAMAIYPKGDKPYMFGLHQCSYIRDWTTDEKALFQEMGRRLADGLTSLLSYRNLQQSEQNYRQFVDTANEGIWMFSADTLTLSVNAKMAEILGYQIEEMVGLPLASFIFDEDLPEYRRKIAIHKQGVAEHFEFRFRHKDGRSVWTLVSATPIFDGEHRFSASFAMLTDITERKQMEEKLQESEKRLRVTLEVTQIGIWDWDISQDHWYASPIYYTMLGYTPRMGLGDRDEWVDRVHPDDLPLVKKEIQNVLSQNFKEYQYEARMRHADGTYRWQLVRGVGIESDSTGKVTRLLGIRIDIADRKRVEEALQESEKRLAQIIDFLPDATFAIDLNGKIIAWNHAIEEMSGVKTTDIIGKGNFEYALPFYGKRRPMLIDLVFKPDDEIRKEYVFVRKEGACLLAEAELPVKNEKRVLWGIARPLYDSRGNAVGAIESLRDITERRLAEEASNKKREELERFEKVTIGRELKMMELKQRIAELEVITLQKEKSDE